MALLLQCMSLLMGAGSLGLDICRLDHLGPLLCISDDELAELGGRVCKRLKTQVYEPCFECRVGECGINLRIEDRDNLRRRVRIWPDIP